MDDGNNNDAGAEGAPPIEKVRVGFGEEKMEGSRGANWKPISNVLLLLVLVEMEVVWVGRWCCALRLCCCCCCIRRRPRFGILTGLPSWSVVVLVVSSRSEESPVDEE